MVSRVVVYLPPDEARAARLVKTVKKALRGFVDTIKVVMTEEEERAYVLFEDDEIKCYLYVDEPEIPLDNERVITTIRTLARLNLLLTNTAKAATPAI